MVSESSNSHQSRQTHPIQLTPGDVELSQSIIGPASSIIEPNTNSQWVFRNRLTVLHLRSTHLPHLRPTHLQSTHSPHLRSTHKSDPRPLQLRYAKIHNPSSRPTSRSDLCIIYIYIFIYLFIYLYVYLYKYLYIYLLFLFINFFNYPFFIKLCIYGLWDRKSVV